MGDERRAPFTGGRFTLELDDKKPVGFVTSIDGGHFKAEAVPSGVGGNFTVTKYPGKPKYEDITVTVGMAMSPAFWKWVKASLDNKPERRNGAIVGYDFNNKERSRRTFTNALISEIGFPSLDGGAKASAQLTIKISPEGLTYQKGDGSSLIMDQALNENVKQKRWLQSNFEFALDRFNGDRRLRNAKIEAFVVKQNVINNPIGAERESRKEVGRLEIPALQVSVPEKDMQGWMEWYDKSVVKGSYEETNGYISYQSPDQKELMRLELKQVGLTSVDIDKYEAGKEAINRIKVSLFVEEMILKPGAGTA
jgi:phage tail-like protein